MVSLGALRKRLVFCAWVPMQAIYDLRVVLEELDCVELLLDKENRSEGSSRACPRRGA